MSDHPRSTATIHGHPIHPMLVPFPIAFLVAVFLCDLAFWSGHNESWAIAAMWSLGAGLVTAALAATAGLIDFAGDSRIRKRDGWHHVISAVSAVVLSLVSFLLRWTQGAAEGALPWGLMLSLLVFLLLLFAGWKGGELVFRHRVGQIDEAEHPAHEPDSYRPHRPSFGE